MPEDRPKYSDIEATAVAGSNHGFRIHLISNPEARGESLPTFRDVESGVVGAVPGYPDLPSVEVGKPALSLAIDRLREIQFPAKAVVEGQLRSNAPAIFDISKESLLRFLGIG